MEKSRQQKELAQHHKKNSNLAANVAKSTMRVPAANKDARVVHHNEQVTRVNEDADEKDKRLNKEIRLGKSGKRPQLVEEQDKRFKQAQRDERAKVVDQVVRRQNEETERVRQATKRAERVEQVERDAQRAKEDAELDERVERVERVERDAQRAKEDAERAERAKEDAERDAQRAKEDAQERDAERIVGESEAKWKRDNKRKNHPPQGNAGSRVCVTIHHSSFRKPRYASHHHLCTTNVLLTPSC